MFLVAVSVVWAGPARPGPVATSWQPPPLSRVPVCGTIVWSGEGGSGRWSDPASWQGGVVPGQCDIVRLGAGAGDSVVDADFLGVVAGVELDARYSGTLRLERDLTINGELVLSGGRLEQGRLVLAMVGLTQRGGELAGGDAPLWIDSAATVSGGLLITPRSLMRVETLAIQDAGVVRMGPNGKLNIAGDGEPLVGDGELDTVTNRPNNVEYTGRASADLTSARPTLSAHGLGRALSADPAGLRASVAITQSGRHGFGEAGPPLTLFPAETTPYASAIDPANGFAYVGTYGSTPGLIVKVRLSDFTRVGAISVPEAGFIVGLIDTQAGAAFFCTRSNPPQVVKIDLATFSRVAGGTLNSGSGYIQSGAIDTVNGFAYFANSYPTPGTITKVRLSDLSQVASMTLGAGEGGTYAAMVDPAGGSAYFSLNTSPGEIIKVRLSDFSRVQTLTLATGENGISSGVLDGTQGFAYFATSARPAEAVQVRLSDFTRVNAATLGATVDGTSASVIDSATGSLLVATGFTSSSLVKIQLPALTVAGSVVLSRAINSAFVDPTSGLCYGVSNGEVSSILRIRVSDLALEGTLQLSSGELWPASSVLDSAGFAYFGMDTDPGIVVKVRLSDMTRVGAITLATGERYLYLALADAANNVAYFISGTAPASVVKVDLSSFTSAASVTLDESHVPLSAVRALHLTGVS